MSTEGVVSTYLDLLDRQRETALGALRGLTEDEIWKRPAPQEWSFGEILDHTCLVLASLLPYARMSRRCLRWLGERRKHRPYHTSTIHIVQASSRRGSASSGRRAIVPEGLCRSSS